MEQIEFQKMVEDAVIKTIQQGEKSVDCGGGCSYRFNLGRRVLKCVVGQIIEDKDYHPNFEDRDVYDLASMNATEKISSLTDCQLEILAHLQRCHDQANSNDFVSSFVENVEIRIVLNSLPNYLLPICENYEQYLSTETV